LDSKSHEVCDERQSERRNLGIRQFKHGRISVNMVLDEEDLMWATQLCIELGEQLSSVGNDVKIIDQIQLKKLIDQYIKQEKRRLKQGESGFPYQ
jgi:hypothetical protein